MAVKKDINIKNIPSSSRIKEEINRYKYRKKYSSLLHSTIFTLVTVAAFAVLVAMLWMPVLQIYGSSMAPTLDKDEIVISLKSSELKTGDVIAFYHGNKLLVKRCIAGPADWVNIDQDGTVYVNGLAIDEPYINEKAFGTCDITLPFQVPEDKYFVMGDHRATSVDSRTTTVGCIAEEEIIGKIVFCIWPMERVRIIH